MAVSNDERGLGPAAHRFFMRAQRPGGMARAIVIVGLPFVKKKLLILPSS
jgi:hypothetical protein